MLKVAILAVVALLLGSCANLSYYAQAVGGHLQIMQASRPIRQIIDDPSTAPGLKVQLEKANAVRDFASRDLGLPDNGSYRKYADLGRPYVVWNVFAAKEFSVELEQWCMLFVGCVNYRGYYDRDDALQLAAELQQQGMETYVGSVPAYSTLGYFDDPVLNTFLRYGEQEVARIIFHELAHQRVFVADDSTFNESFATTVENEAMRRWLVYQGNEGQLRNFQKWQQRKEQFQKLVAEYRNRLREAYAKPMGTAEKRHAKEAVISDLKQSYADLKAEWGSAYEAFFNQQLNNASLGSVSLYNRLVPAFDALLEDAGYDLPRFYQRVEALAHLGKDERSAALDQIEYRLQSSKR